MSSERQLPTFSGGTNELALHHSHAVLSACHGAMMADARLNTLQKRPAPIAHLDVLHPFPLPVHPMIPLPGDPGGYATSRALEDR